MQRKLVCPINFGMVEEDLYRSGQPSEINFPFLSTLNLKTIIWLAVEEPQENFLAWADDNDITIHHLGIQEGRDIWDPMLTEDCVVDALNVIVRVGEIGPLAIMCNLGRHRTGTVVGCLRRLQRWNLASVTDEYRRYAGHRWRVINELHIESFNTSLVTVPDNPPAWLVSEI